MHDESLNTLTCYYIVEEFLCGYLFFQLEIKVNINSTLWCNAENNVLPLIDVFRIHLCTSHKNQNQIREIVD
jgi:hypothetical protein